MTIPGMPPPGSAMLYGQAAQGIALAANLGFPLPERWAHFVECIKIARGITDEPEPVFEVLPDDPAKLRPAIVKAANLRAAHAAMKEMAAAALDEAQRAALMQYRAALPGYVDQLAEQFTEVAAAFLEQRRAGASDTLSANDSDEQIAAHVAMTRAAARLDQLAAIRLQFGRSANEPDLHDRLPWHVLKPASVEETDRVQTCRDVVYDMYRDARTWDARRPVERWTLLANAGELTIAPLWTIADRMLTWQNVDNEAAGDPAMTPLGKGVRQREREQRMAVAAVQSR